MSDILTPKRSDFAPNKLICSFMEFVSSKWFWDQNTGNCEDFVEFLNLEKAN